MLFGKYNNHGGILTGEEIKDQVSLRKIIIKPFDADSINPNSYNIRIGDIVQMYDNVDVIDLKNPDTYKTIREYKIPAEGMILRPGNLYLIKSYEIFGSTKYVPIITGRSSMGRLGIQLHHEAGFGDIGYIGQWAFQVKVSFPTKIYPGLKMAQVYFISPEGDYSRQYDGHYKAGQMISQYNVYNDKE